MITKGTLGRREIVKKTAQAVATVAVCEGMTPAAAQAAPPAQQAGAIPVRTLGKTGLEVPILGYGGAALINTGEFEVCMLSYGYMPRGSSSVWSARMTQLRDDCLAKAHELGMGIVAMKVIGGGWLGRWSGYLVPGFDKQRIAKLPGAAIRHVLQDQRIHLLAIGMHLKSQIDANITTFTGEAKYTPQDRALLAEFSAKLDETETLKKLRMEQ
jgi:hypothetical protein